jgi:hypothetical protein
LIYLGFITEGKLAAIFITPSLGVPNWPVIYIINYTPIKHQQVFWHHSTPRHHTAIWPLTASVWSVASQDSWRHSLLDCLQARSVWALALKEIGEFIANLHEPHARRWLFAVLKDSPREASIRVLVTLWALWHARRKNIHEGQFQSPPLTHLFVECFITELGQLAPVPVSKLVRSASAVGAKVDCSTGGF